MHSRAFGATKLCCKTSATNSKALPTAQPFALLSGPCRHNTQLHKRSLHRPKPAQTTSAMAPDAAASNEAQAPPAADPAAASPARDDSTSNVAVRPLLQACDKPRWLQLFAAYIETQADGVPEEAQDARPHPYIHGSCRQVEETRADVVSPHVCVGPARSQAPGLSASKHAGRDAVMAGTLAMRLRVRTHPAPAGPDNPADAQQSPCICVGER